LETTLSFPMYAALVAGFVVSYMQREKHPHAALFAMIGFGLLIFDQFIGYPVLTWLNTNYYSAILCCLFRAMLSLAVCAAYLALLAAIFHERPAAPNASETPPSSPSSPPSSASPPSTPPQDASASSAPPASPTP
jgi:hypothetical protein